MSIFKEMFVMGLTALTFFGSFLGTRGVVDFMDYSSPRSYVTMVTNGLGSGSAVVLAPGLALTAAHVVGPVGESFTIDGKSIKVVRYDATLDLALLEVDGLACPCAPLGSLPTIDDLVVAVGFPLTAGQFVTEGRMQGVNFKDTRIETSVPIMFGNSGGGLFAFQQTGWGLPEWKLVGIVVQLHGASLGMFNVPVPHMSRAVPIVNIMEFLHRDAK